MVREIEPKARLPKRTNAEHRSSTRFPLNLEVRYTVLSHLGPAGAGYGTACDMSSSGLSFIAGRPLPIGQKLRVSVDWPVLLHGGVPLQLVVDGVVVRTGGAVMALQIERHEFRTRRVGLKFLPD
jgi:hypothetical protein